MKKTTLFFTFLSLIFLISCKVTSPPSTGIYQFISKELTISLEFLSKDEFQLKIRSSPHSRSYCSGKWYRIASGNIELLCEEEPVEQKLSSAYLTTRKWEVEVLNNNRLRFQNYILKRK